MIEDTFNVLFIMQWRYTDSNAIAEYLRCFFPLTYDIPAIDNSHNIMTSS